MKLYFKQIENTNKIIGRVYYEDGTEVQFQWRVGCKPFFPDRTLSREVKEQLSEFITANILNKDKHHRVGAAAKEFAANNFTMSKHVAPSTKKIESAKPQAPRFQTPVMNKPQTVVKESTPIMTAPTTKAPVDTSKDDEIAKLKAEIERLQALEVKHSNDLQLARKQAQTHYIALSKANAELEALKSATVDPDPKLETAYRKLYHENKLLKAQLKVYREKKAATIDSNAIVSRDLDAMSICHIIRTIGLVKDAFAGMTHKEIISLCMKRAWAYKNGELDLTAAVLAGSVNLPKVTHENEIAATIDEPVIHEDETEVEDTHEEEIIENKEEDDKEMESEPEEKVTVANGITLYMSYNKSTQISIVYEQIGEERTRIGDFKTAAGRDRAFSNFISEYGKLLKDPKYKNATIVLNKAGIDTLAKKRVIQGHIKRNNITIQAID